MTTQSSSGSEADENAGDSSPEDVETQRDEGEGEVPEYEKQRLLRIKENRERMQALGLRNLASSVFGSASKQKRGVESGKRKGRKKRDEDDDYTPVDGEQVESSSSEATEEEEEALRRGSASKSKVNKRSQSNVKRTKKDQLERLHSNSDFIDNDTALQQAIALSLANQPENSRASPVGQKSGKDEGSSTKESTGTRKKRNLMRSISRVQMTEDEMVAYFFSFDESGKGYISLRDLRKMATLHNFTWTDNELVDMIHGFDSDRDGKLTLDDFRAVVTRCNLLRSSENAG
ncbi:hypothetical protein H6P81_005250 [Aristolochia fimbriata]|uniref:EF-hand domain-containing protein n=1 Tax=Aristolochia fimbriata TaxID=158543 RepID=A0AAV7EV30_ARIFI|nr:hypothetical protein H6P81_005250 [Aristolochia fimbriata]